MTITAITVCGASGRMGRTVARLAAEAADLRIVGGIGAEPLGPEGAGAAGYPAIGTLEDADALIADADVVIDFSAPGALETLLGEHGGALRGKALLVGTTGLESAQETLLEELSRSAAVLTAANFSIGVNILLGLVERAAAALDAENFDAEIVEAHHRRKADAPSGTALALGKALAQGRGTALDGLRRDGRSGQVGARTSGEIGFHALRGGDIVGEHRVHFIGERERLEFAHVATDRALFAEGALRAARWMRGKAPGRYTMKDVLGI